jgi:hypothetical protein
MTEAENFDFIKLQEVDQNNFAYCWHLIRQFLSPTQAHSVTSRMLQA